MKKILKNVIIFFLSLFLLWYAFKGIEFSEILENLKEVKYIYVIISFILGYLAYFVRAVRWEILIKSIGYKSKLINSNNSVSIAYFSNLIFPRAGEVIRCSTMSKLENIPMNKLFGTVIIERVIDFIVLFGLILFALFLEEESIKSFFNNVLEVRNQQENPKESNIIFPVILLFIIFIITLFFIFKKRILKMSIYIKILGFLVGVKEGILSIKSMDNKFIFILYTFIIWICYFFMNYIVFLSFKETQDFGISEGLVLLVVGGLAMIVPVQGGIGSYHLAIKIMLSFYGITEITALSFATLVHTTQTLVALIFGGIAFLHVAFLLKKKI